MGDLGHTYPSSGCVVSTTTTPGSQGAVGLLPRLGCGMLPTCPYQQPGCSHAQQLPSNPHRLSIGPGLPPGTSVHCIHLWSPPHTVVLGLGWALKNPTPA